MQKFRLPFFYFFFSGAATARTRCDWKADAWCRFAWCRQSTDGQRNEKASSKFLALAREESGTGSRPRQLSMPHDYSYELPRGKRVPFIFFPLAGMRTVSTHDLTLQRPSLCPRLPIQICFVSEIVSQRGVPGGPARLRRERRRSRVRP